MKQQIHLSSEFGEIIDLYSLCVIDGTYHIFILYKTDSENKKWGHFSTKDFLQYKFLSGKADIIGHKPCTTHFFANTEDKTLMLELIKTPGKKAHTFLSLPREVIIRDEELLKYPPENLHDLREYKRKVNLQNGENSDTFGCIFEAILNFSETDYTIKLRDDILVDCESGNFTVTYNGLSQNFEAEDCKKVHVFSDNFSVEIFVGGKVLSLPTEYNVKGTVAVLKGQCRAEIYKLKSINVL